MNIAEQLKEERIKYLKEKYSKELSSIITSFRNGKGLVYVDCPDDNDKTANDLYDLFTVNGFTVRRIHYRDRIDCYTKELEVSLP